MRGEEDEGSWKGYIIYGILLFFPLSPSRAEGHQDRRGEKKRNSL